MTPHTPEWLEYERMRIPLGFVFDRALEPLWTAATEPRAFRQPAATINGRLKRRNYRKER